MANTEVCYFWWIRAGSAALRRGPRDLEGDVESIVRSGRNGIHCHQLSVDIDVVAAVDGAGRISNSRETLLHCA